MCCSVNKRKGKNSTTIEARIYTKEEMEQVVKAEEGAEALFFEYGGLKFCVIYIEEYFRGTSSLEFYSMSKGLEGYTETGYHSNFVNKGESVSQEDVEDYFKFKLKECGIDLDNPKMLFLSEVGGVLDLYQPSLF